MVLGVLWLGRSFLRLGLDLRRRGEFFEFEVGMGLGGRVLEVPHHPGVLLELFHGEGAGFLVFLEDEAGSGEFETEFLDGPGDGKPLLKDHIDQHFSSLD